MMCIQLAGIGSFIDASYICYIRYRPTIFHWYLF